MSFLRFRWIAFALLSPALMSCNQEQLPRVSAKKKAESPPATPAASEKIDPVHAVQSSPIPDSAPKAVELDAKQRETIVGVWKQSNTGIRWLRVRPDGTATMYIDPDWIAKAIIGDSLTMQIEWSIDEGRAVMNSVSGKPQTAFKAVTTMFGRERNRPIVKLNETHFVLRDEEDGSLSSWTRVDADAALPETVAE